MDDNDPIKHAQALQAGAEAQASHFVCQREDALARIALVEARCTLLREALAVSEAKYQHWLSIGEQRGDRLVQFTKAIRNEVDWCGCKRRSLPTDIDKTDATLCERCFRLCRLLQEEGSAS